MRLAMAARIGDIATSSNSASGRGGITNCGREGTAVGRGAPVGWGAAAGRGAAWAASTSRRMMRPPGPVPSISRRSTPVWPAILRASGEAFTRPPAGLAAAAAGAGAATAAGGIGTTAVVAGTDR